MGKGLTQLEYFAHGTLMSSFLARAVFLFLFVCLPLYVVFCSGSCCVSAAGRAVNSYETKQERYRHGFSASCYSVGVLTKYQALCL